MEHPIFRVTFFEIVGPYTVRLRFDDDTEQVINFKPILRGQMFGPLRNLDLFNQVQIDPDFHTLVWPTGADLDPADLHDWPEIKEDFIAHAKAYWKEPEKSKP